MENASEQLKHLRVFDVVETGRILGTGSYGQVEEVHFNGLKCAGKKLHSYFFDQTSLVERQSILSGFVEECIM